MEDGIAGDGIPYHADSHMSLSYLEAVECLSSTVKPSYCTCRACILNFLNISYVMKGDMTTSLIRKMVERMSLV